MKLFKKLLAMGLCAVLVLSMVGCHKKNETALTIDGVKITSALYLSALFECDTEARTKVDESKKSSSSSAAASTSAWSVLVSLPILSLRALISAANF